MGELLSHNVFAYCANNVVNKFDPSGFRYMEVENGGGISSPYIPPISTYSGNSAGSNYLSYINNASSKLTTNRPEGIYNYFGSQSIAGIDFALKNKVNSPAVQRFGGVASVITTGIDLGKNSYNTINGQYSLLEGMGRSTIDAGFTFLTAAFATFAIISLPATAIGVTVGIFVSGTIGYGMGCLKDALKEGLFENNKSIKLDNNRSGTSYGWYTN